MRQESEGSAPAPVTPGGEGLGSRTLRLAELRRKPAAGAEPAPGRRDRTTPATPAVATRGGVAALFAIAARGGVAALFAIAARGGVAALFAMASPAAAQVPVPGGIRCSAFLHERGGAWRAFEPGVVFGPRGPIPVRTGERFRRGRPSASDYVARVLDRLCRTD